MGLVVEDAVFVDAVLEKLACLAADLKGLVGLEERIAKIETSLALLLQQRTVKDFYTTKEVAELLKRTNTRFASGAATGESMRRSAGAVEGSSRSG